MQYEADAVLTFPRGLPGFDGEREFAVLQQAEQYPLVYMQSLSTPDLCFLALPVLSVDRDYKLCLLEEDASLLALPQMPVIGKDVLCLALVSAHETCPTANLMAPLVVNLRTRRTAQCLSPQPEYSLRHELFALAEAAV